MPDHVCSDTDSGSGHPGIVTVTRRVATAGPVPPPPGVWAAGCCEWSAYPYPRPRGPGLSPPSRGKPGPPWRRATQAEIRGRGPGRGEEVQYPLAARLHSISRLVTDHGADTAPSASIPQRHSSSSFSFVRRPSRDRTHCTQAPVSPALAASFQAASAPVVFPVLPRSLANSAHALLYPSSMSCCQAASAASQSLVRSRSSSRPGGIAGSLPAPGRPPRDPRSARRQ
jgi:hypothetical protein